MADIRGLHDDAPIRAETELGIGREECCSLVPVSMLAAEGAVCVENGLDLGIGQLCARWSLVD